MGLTVRDIHSNRYINWSNVPTGQIVKYYGDRKKKFVYTCPYVLVCSELALSYNHL